MTEQVVKAPKLSELQQYGALSLPHLFDSTVTVFGLDGFTGLLASGAGAAKALPARRTATARIFVNCIFIWLMVLNRGMRRMDLMIVWIS